MRRNLLIAFLAGVVSFSCAFNLAYNEEEYLDRPDSLSVTALSGGRFQVSYYVQNKENTFDGYNLYVTRYASGDSGGSTEIYPYNYDGSVPTFLHTNADYDLNNPVTVTLTDFMGVTFAVDGSTFVYYVPFESGVTYYFKIKAHSQFDTLSEFSNEVALSALP